MSRNIFFLCFFSILAISFTTQAQDIIRYNGSSTILRAIMYKATSDFDKQTGIKFDLKGNNTGAGIEKLLAGECDIAGGGRPLKASEKQEGLIETPIFYDAYAFIVNKKNTLQAITPSQINNIMHGTFTSWNELGLESSGHIRIISPPEHSAHYKNFKKQIGFHECPKGTKFANMSPNVATEIINSSAGFGWLSYANVMKNNRIKILDLMVNGQQISINEDSVLSGEYPYGQKMYFYTIGQPEGTVKKFIDFMQSEAGGQIIREAGFFAFKKNIPAFTNDHLNDSTH